MVRPGRTPSRGGAPAGPRGPDGPGRASRSWNHNLHYYPLIVSAVPGGCDRRRDAAAALRQMRALLQPGGTLAVLGLCRSRYPADLPREAIAAIAIRAYRLTRSYCELQAPTVWPPPEDYAGMQRLARRELPGARFRRLVLWRYSPVWVKPG